MFLDLTIEFTVIVLTILSFRSLAKCELSELILYFSQGNFSNFAVQCDNRKSIIEKFERLPHCLITEAHRGSILFV
jgi:hypothetical protein